MLLLSKCFVLFTIFQHPFRPEFFQYPVEVCFVQVNDPKSMDRWIAWVLLPHDVERLAPPLWGEAEFDGNLNE
jgi:hypothetical protein